MNRRLSRASFLRALSGLLAVGALEACAPAAAPTPTPAAAPKAAAPAEPTKPAAEAPKPAEPTKPAAEAPKPAEPTKPAVATKPAAEPTKPAVAPAGPAKADKVKLDIFTSHSPKEKKEYDLMTSEYTKLRPNVEFGEVAFGTSQDPIEALLARLAGGNAPDVAIVFDSPVSLAVRGARRSPACSSSSPGRSACSSSPPTRSWRPSTSPSPSTTSSSRRSGPDYRTTARCSAPIRRSGPG
jgi:ABC-type glycerol-3-phosphate transport system substrate-binding protein